MTTPHSSNFSKLAEAAKGLQKSLPLKQAEKIEASLMPAILKQVEKTRGPIKRMYESAYNSCSSMVDGLKGGDTTPVDYREFIDDFSKLSTRASQVETAALNPKERPPMEERATDSEEWLLQQTKRAAEVLKKYSRIEAIVPRALPKKFHAMRLPLLVLTNPGLNRDKLAALKILDDTFFGYPILKNQVLLGLNSDWVTSEYRGNLSEATEDIIEILKTQTNKKYFVLGDSRKRGHVDWTWLVTESDMRRMNASSMSGHFAIKAWSFPFEADDAIRKNPPKAPA